MAVTTVQRERLARRFDLWDNNHSGRIDRSDFKAEAQEILGQFNESETSPRGKAVMDAYLQMWDVIAEQAGISPNGDLDKDAYIESAERTVLEKGDKGFAEVVRPTIRAIVDLCDTDGSGQISSEEWKRWAKAIGMSPQKAQEAFQGIDTDRSGQLSTDELVQVVNDYHAGRTDVELLG